MQTEDIRPLLLTCGDLLSAAGKDAFGDLLLEKHARQAPIETRMCQPPCKMECVIMGKKHVGLALSEEGREVYQEKLSGQYACGLFVVTNHTRSKPDNFVFSRPLDHRIYCVVELKVESFLSIQLFTTSAATVQGTKAKGRILKKRK